MDKNLSAEEIIQKYKDNTSFKFKDPSELETLLVAIKTNTCDTKSAISTIVCGFDLLIKSLSYKFYNTKSKLITSDELIMICRESIIECIRTFNLEKTDNITPTFISYYKKACIRSLYKSLNKAIKYSAKSMDGSTNTKDCDKDDSLHNVIPNKSIINFDDEIMIKELKENIIPKLPLSYQRVLIMHYFEHKQNIEIAKIENVAPGAITQRIKRAIKQLNSILEKDNILIFKNTTTENLPQTQVMNKLRNNLDKYEGKIDIETELLPYLSKEHVEIYNKYIKNADDIKGTNLSKTLGKNINYVKNAIPYIFNKIEYIIQRKQEIADFYQKIGGIDQLEDIKSILSDEEKIVLENYILNPNLDSYTKTSEVLGCKYSGSLSQMARYLNAKIDKILTNKQMAKEFIEMNGGEDFLLYDFGSTLDYDQFLVLTTIMMDYHYIDKTNVAKALGRHISYVNNAETAIMKKLDNYYAQKKEIDDLVESAGGADKVISEIYNNLNDTQKILFLEYTLAYIKPKQIDIANKIGRSIDYVYNTSKDQINKLKSMSKEIIK